MLSTQVLATVLLFSNSRLFTKFSKTFTYSSYPSLFNSSFNVFAT